MNCTPLIIAFAITASCAPSSPDMVIDDPWARATAPGQTSGAVYATVINRGAADRLVEVTSGTGTAMLHRSDAADGVARMRMLSEVAIPADGKLDLAPGGTHVMVTGLATPLAVGAEFPLTFRFAQAGSRTVRVAVVAAGAR